MTDYAATKATFRPGVPDEYNFTRDVIDRWAVDSPEKIALIALFAHAGLPAIVLTVMP